MITILIFNEDPGAEVTLNCPEIKRTPSEIARLVSHHIQVTTNPVIRTYSSIPIEVIGHKIEFDGIEPGSVIVKTSGLTCRFDEEGVLRGGWPHGIFNWNLRGQYESYLSE